MLLLKFSILHMIRHWRMNLVVLAALLLSTIFLSGLPSYATAIAGQNLRQQLDEAPPASRNVRVSGDGLSSAVYGELGDLLGPLILDRIEVRSQQPIEGPSVFYQPADNTEIQVDEYLRFTPQSFSELSSLVDVVQGRLPDHLGPVPNRFYSVLEAVIGADAATNATFSQGKGTQLDLIHLKVGDQLQSTDGTLRINIVGIVTPQNAEDDAWWGDSLPFSFRRQKLHGWSFPDTLTISLLMSPLSMETYFPNHDRYWRVLTDVSQISVDNAAETHLRLSSAESQMKVKVDSSLIAILDAYQQSLSTARTTLFLLTAQSMLFVFYTLIMISSYVLRQSQSELSSLAGRGFTRRQITLIFAIQGGIIAFAIAAPLGPYLAKAALSAWGLLTSTTTPSSLTRESWILSTSAALFGWLILVGSIYLGSKQTLIEWEHQLARPSVRASWQRYYVDFLLLALGGLIFWQLSDTGAFADQRFNPGQNISGPSDPFLLLGPSLLLIALALVFLRLFPLLLRIASWRARQNRGLVLPFGLARLARDPAAPSRVVMLISLAAGLTLFATLFENSLANRQIEIAHYQTGADLRVSVPLHAQEEIYQEFARLPGVQTASPVYLNNRTYLTTALSRQTTLLAVDPDTFPQTARFAPHTSSLTMSSILDALPADPGSLAIPAVFSYDASPTDKEIGDTLTYVIGSQKTDFEVRGIIQNFPYVEGPFFVADLGAIEAAVDLETISGPRRGVKEMWLEVDPESQSSLADMINSGKPLSDSRVTGDAQVKAQQLKSDLVARETSGAFELNAFTMAALSVAIFILVHFFSAQQRRYEFSILRAMGLSHRQLFGLLSLEGSILAAIGMAAGCGLGYGLALLMRPLLSRTLAVALGGDAIYDILVNWPEVSGLLLMLAGSYALALLLLLIALLRTGIHHAMRLGDE